MYGTRVLLTSLAVTMAVSASTIKDHLFSTLLKRQEPGTPAYNCHDNCGQAIIISKAGGDICKDPAFLSDYKNCLQCAGPDNVNIWQYYGGTLTKAVSGCGLSTSPLSGKQPDVGPATAAGATAKGSSAAPSSAAITQAATSTVIKSSISSIVETQVPTSVATSTLSTGPSATLTANSTGNVSASSTSSLPLQATGAASSDFGTGMGVWGAILLGAVYAVGN